MALIGLLKSSDPMRDSMYLIVDQMLALRVLVSENIN